VIANGHLAAALIAQGPFEVASRFRGPPPLATARENASGFDTPSAYLDNTTGNPSIPSPTFVPVPQYRWTDSNPLAATNRPQSV
jgi:hypothetical protein